MRVNFFQLRSIKSRLMVFTLAVFLIGIWSLAFYASSMLREDMQRLLGEQQFSKVSFAATQINEDLQQRLQALERVASDIGSGLLDDQAALQAVLERNKEFQALFNGGTRITRLDGSVVATVPFSAERLSANYADRDYMIGALKAGKATIGNPVLGKILKAPVFGMAVPIRDEKARVIGAVVGAINLGQPNFLDKITESNPNKTAGYLLLVTPQQRLIVTASDKNRIMEQQPAPGINPVIDSFMAGYEGSALMTNPLGVEVLASTKRIPVSGWLIVNSLPTEEAFAPLYAMQQRVMLVAVFLSLLAGALTWRITSWILHRQLSPMIAATDTLTTRATSNRHWQPLPVTSQDEIGELIAGFNRLMGTLAQREKALNEAQRIAKIGSWSLDLASGRLIWSDEIFRLFEIDPQQFAATYDAFLNAIHPDDRDAVNKAYTESLANRAPYEIIHRLRMGDGRIKWVQERSVSEFDASGKPVRSSGTVQDITERKLADEFKKESYERLTAVFNSLDAIVYVADMETHELLFVNQFVIDIFGDIVGKPCWQGIQNGQSGPCAYCTNDKLLDADGNPTGIYHWEFQNTLNGHWYDIRDKAIKWIDGRTVRLEIATDITERKEFESELKRSNAELEQFSYAISHDMRQPLRMISGHLGLLEKSIAAHLDGDQRESFRFAIEGARRLDQMLVGLLDYSRVGRKGEPPARIESRALLGEALLFLQPAIEEAQAEIVIEGDWPRIFVSPDEMLRLMQNLIGNAIKFRVAGRTPKVTVTSATGNKTWRLCISDNGVGIIPEQITRLFQMFQRLQGRTAYEGNGIGLAICRKIVERHGGKIWAESAGEGQGSRFCVSLPQEGEAPSI
ncbi:MAG: PAS domain-containing protein [Betaproteobacteria bacterium]|nr:PAS domain-containing protein [Betaproteobacteria bacterium]